MNTQLKIVDFTNCKKCKFYNTPDTEEPCNECIKHSVNENSEYPVNYDGPKPEVKRRERNE